MLYTNVLTLLLAATSSVSATACKNPGKRQAWHNLSKAQKLDYINAESCLMKKPATAGFAGARTVFDEIQAIHQIQAYKVHQVVSSTLIRAAFHAPETDKEGRAHFCHGIVFTCTFMRRHSESSVAIPGTSHTGTKPVTPETSASPRSSIQSMASAAMARGRITASPLAPSPTTPTHSARTIPSPTTAWIGSSRTSKV